MGVGWHIGGNAGGTKYRNLQCIVAVKRDSDLQYVLLFSTPCFTQRRLPKDGQITAACRTLPPLAPLFGPKMFTLSLFSANMRP